MRIEKEVQHLEQEMKALKTSFEQSATSMNIYTTTTSITTQANKITADINKAFDYYDWLRITSLFGIHDSADPYSYYVEEPVIVTFRSQNGANVIANLEIDSNATEGFIKVQRIPFNGGARWKLMIYPLLEPVGNPVQYYIWSPTVLQLAVQCGVKGTLEAKMAWQ